MSETGEPNETRPEPKPSGNKMLTLQTLLYFIIGSTPVIVSTVSTHPDDTPVTWKFLTILIAGSLGGGAISVKAFLSTTFADSSANADGQRTKKVEIDQPSNKPVPVDQT